MSGTLSAALGETQKVLVGLGEEWAFDFNEILQDSEYGCVMQKAMEEFPWLAPYIQYHYQVNREDSRKKAFLKLFDLLKGKDYFIVSTINDVDLTQYGFDDKKIVFPCGNQIFLQEKQKKDGMLLPASESLSFQNLMKEIDLLLKKEITISDISGIFANGDELIFNQKHREWIDAQYNESSYLPQWALYQEWVAKTLSRELLLLELGAGLDYPTVIRFPFEKIALINKKAYLMRVHEKLYQLTKEINEKAVSIPVNSVAYILQE